MRPTTSCQFTVKGILYKDFVVPSVNWGKSNEDRAKVCKIEISESGLFINKSWLHLGASPDGKR